MSRGGLLFLCLAGFSGCAASGGSGAEAAQSTTPAAAREHDDVLALDVSDALVLED